MFEVLFYNCNGEVLLHGIYSTWADIDLNRPVECVRVDVSIAYN